MRNFLSSIWFLLFVAVLAGRNPYEILGVTKQANLSRIKKAYRNLSRTHHPDRNPSDPKAAEKFSDITWAYEVLTNETLRGAFDRGGEEAVKAAESGRPMPGSGGPGQFFFGGGAGGGIPFIFRQAFSRQGGGGGFPGGMPGADFHRPPTQPPLVNLDWFNDSSVKIISSSADLDALSTVWPDVVLTIRNDSSDAEKVAREFVAVAEQLDAYFEFEAVDCRRSRAHLCSILGKHQNRPFEISLVYQASERQSSRDSGLRVSHVTPKSMSASAMQQWIVDRLPSISTTASNSSSLKKGVQLGKPIILLLTHKVTDMPIRLRQWAVEQQARATFIVANGAALKDSVLNAIARKESISGWTSYAVLIADPDVINENTIEWMEMSPNSNTDFTVDLTLAKWVAMMKKKSGPYASARRAIRTYDPQQKGICDNSDASWCIFYFGPTQHALYREFAESVPDCHLEAKFYALDNASRATFIFGATFGVEAGTPSLIAYKGKRNKFVRYKNTMRVIEWLDALHDTGILMREGSKREEF